MIPSKMRQKHRIWEQNLLFQFQWFRKKLGGKAITSYPEEKR